MVGCGRNWTGRTGKIGGIWRQSRIPKWRAMADSNLI
jgi:hypothetical protein